MYSNLTNNLRLNYAEELKQFLILLGDSIDIEMNADKTTPQSPDLEVEEEFSDRIEYPSRWAWLGRILFRLLLLGVGGSLAAVAGILFAIASPRPQAQKPLVLEAWEILQRQTKQLNKTPEPAEPGTVKLPAISLTRSEKQQVQAQVDGLNKEWTSVRDRAQELEARLGIENSADRPLTERIETIEQALGQATTMVGDTPIAVDNSPLAANQVKVTLPSDVLFAENNTLSKDANLILDTIVTDLQRYSGSTIRIAVHTDDKGSAELNRERSFRQAEMLKNHLSQRLGKEYRWVAIGYGQTRPLVENDTPANRQRNRRVEIAVD
ncbi:OmpA family protein [Lusitaniella coriacea LEGE 07157]|uniref:OmpA family protein n=1 Tax=Lusitaniella coriacea LEGE 07157 TaxID=945747 RepID=A0A8J7IRE2_9CYAN|nr:OmpA family protein [Lusitaniella coriacea]MBE9115712.1 OmpA family protein [Lusitaniella coriacea LEGE 07157]